MSSPVYARDTDTGQLVEIEAELNAGGKYGLLVSGAGGGGSGGSSTGGTVTAPGVPGTTAQAVQGIPGGVPMVSRPRNVTTYRDGLEAYTPGEKYTQVLGDGDFVALDGNAVGASYLVVSKSPLHAGTTTTLESLVTFKMPFEASLGLGTSQRVMGTEISVEFVDTDAPMAPLPRLAIASITQTGSTLTIVTTLPHGLQIGACIGVEECSDPRANYPATVVSGVLATDQFVCTSLPGGNLPATTITNPAGAKGFVFFRERLGRAQNGMSQIFESANAAAASYYVRSNSGDSLPSGIPGGNHHTACQGTASSALASGPFTYAFAPGGEFRYLLGADRTQFHDTGVDSTNTTNNRYARTQVCPDPTVDYKLRIRAVNQPSLTVPSAQIIRVTKTGTTTALFELDQPHQLVVGDLVLVYGVRDQVNVGNSVLGVAVVSVPSTTTFTAVLGIAATVTSYGGYVAKVQGQTLMSTLGAHPSAFLNASLTTAPGGLRVLAVTASGNWTGVAIGDHVNLVGVRNNTTGALLGVDGVWKIANFSGGNIVFIPGPGNTPPADFGATDCGGALIKRTELRISYIRVFDFDRQRVEMLARPSNDQSNAAQVMVAGGSITQLNGGPTAEDAPATTNPNLVGGIAATALAPVTMVNGDVARLRMNLGGAVLTKPYAPAEAGWTASLALTTTTAAVIAAAAGAGLKRHITALQAINTGAAATELIILDGATERWRFALPVNVPVLIQFPTELVTTVNTALNANLSVAGTVRGNFQGYTSQ